MASIMVEEQGSRGVKDLAPAPTVQRQRAVDAGAQLAFLSLFSLQNGSIHLPGGLFSLRNLTGNALTDTLRSLLKSKISHDTVKTKLFHGSRPVFLSGW